MQVHAGTNSATSAVAGFAGVIDDAILPSAGVELRPDKEHLIWNQFIRTCQEDWRDMDLILQAKIVKMEADIRAAQADLDRVGKIVTLSTAAKWRKAIDVTKCIYSLLYLSRQNVWAKIAVRITIPPKILRPPGFSPRTVRPRGKKQLLER